MRNLHDLGDYFKVHEVVPPELWDRYGELAIRYMDPRLLANLVALRKQINLPMTINNYRLNGDRTSSGLRTPESSHYSMGSAHSYGMAIDAVGPFNVKEVRQKLLDESIVLPYPCRIEMNVSWLHIDVMALGPVMVQTFNP
jgi:hypothetical protein